MLTLARILLILSITLCIIVVAYSVAMTATAGQVVAYALAAVGAGILALLVMVGLIDADRANDGLLTSVLALLPRALRHAMVNGPRALLWSLTLIGVAALSYWIGPGGLGAVSVACGEADKLRPMVGSTAVTCPGTYAERFWRPPFNRASAPKLVCYDTALNAWDGNWTGPGLGGCGPRPREARFARTGIAMPDFIVAQGSATASRDRSAFEQLASGLANELPDVRQFDDTLLFATWNIKALGHATRLNIAYAHIAQVISHFDVVAF